MKSEISALCKYFSKELPKLQSNYEWRIPELTGFPMSGEKNYEANVKLKKHFYKLWGQTENRGEKINLARAVISDWGGVRNNKTETLKNYIEIIQADENPSLPIKGVASYSKLYSIVDPKKYAIYDARVAVCLNAVQFNSNIRNGLAFNYVAGRNNTTGHAGKKIGFAHDNRFVAKNLIRDGWTRIKRDDTYTEYLRTLRDCLKLFPSYGLHDLEMVLFANAERECIKAMTP